MQKEKLNEKLRDCTGETLKAYKQEEAEGTLMNSITFGMEGRDVVE